MKKLIITLLFISCFCFSTVTGILVDKGTGVFVSTHVVDLDKISTDIHYDAIDSFSPFFINSAYSISFEHVMDSGLEFGFTYAHVSENYNPMRLQFNYHFNNKILFGLNLDDFTDDLAKSIHSTYHDNDSFIDFTYNLDAEKHQLSLEVGQLWQMNSMIFGTSYSANVSDIHMGFIYITLGSIF